MKPYHLLIAGILIFGLALILYYCNKPQKTTVSDTIKHIEKIDSIKSEIDSLYIVKDSIYIQIDTIYKQLNNNNKEYEKNFNTIINNTSDENVLFFKNYIESNRERLDSMCINSKY